MLAGPFLGLDSLGREARVLAFILIGLGASLFAPARAQVVDCGRGPQSIFDENRWSVTDAGTVIDRQNGVIWKQCPEGLRGMHCRDGRLAYLTWEQALERAEKSLFAGLDGWRIPKLDELRQMIEPECLFPAVNLALFPNTPSSWFWFDSAEADNSPRAGQLGFAFGEQFSANQRHVVHLRLVRDVPDETIDEPLPGEPVDAEAAVRDAEDALGEPAAGQTEEQVLIDPDNQADEPGGEPGGEPDENADDNQAPAQDDPDNPD